MAGLAEVHNCWEHASWKGCDSVETHGLDCGPFERFHDEWLECTVCGGRYTEPEMDALFAAATETSEVTK